MDTFYKVVRPDLSSFHDPGYVWRIGGTHRPATPKADRLYSKDDICTNAYLFASRTPEQAPATIATWPYRLLEVQGKPAVEYTDKAGFHQLKVTRERDVALCFGPNGAAVLKIIRQAETLTPEQIKQLNFARACYLLGVAWDATAAARDAWEAAAYAVDSRAARYAAWDAIATATATATAGDYRATAGDYRAARYAAWVARYVAWGATGDDLVGQHGLEQHHIDALMAPWREVFPG